MEPVTIVISGRSPVARMDSWSLDIFDQDGSHFRSFDGKWPGDGGPLGWKVQRRELGSAGQSYSAHATLRDEFGNSAQVSTAIAVVGLSAPVPPRTTGTVALTAGTAGFSPNGDTVMDSIALVLSYGAQKSVSSWKVEIMDSDRHVQKTFLGDGSNLPASVRWDGKNETGKVAQEGTYTGRLYRAVRRGIQARLRRQRLLCSGHHSPHRRDHALGAPVLAHGGVAHHHAERERTLPPGQDRQLEDGDL